MRPGKITTLITAAALVFTPTVAAAASAPQDSGVRASAELNNPSSIDEGGTVLIALILAILFAMAVLSDDDEPNNIPASP